MTTKLQDENTLYDALCVRAPILNEDGILPGDLERLDAEIQEAFHQRVPGVAEPVYCFPATPSTQSVDSYGTRMSSDTMVRYLSDVLEGVPLMDSHKAGGWFEPPSELPLGRTFAGEIVNGDFVMDESPMLLRDEIPDPSVVDLINGGQQVRAWSYMLHDHNPNGPSKLGTEDVIRSIEGGTLKSVSIGFGSAFPDRLFYECGLCGENMMSWDDCPHIPLVRDNETGLIAFAWIRNAMMNEFSLVWQGATPGAVVEKARMAARAGSLDKVEVDMLENLWRVRIAKPGGSSAGVSIRKVETEGVNMSGTDEVAGDAVVEEETEETVEEEVIVSDTVDEEELEDVRMALLQSIEQGVHGLGERMDTFEARVDTLTAESVTEEEVLESEPDRMDAVLHLLSELQENRKGDGSDALECLIDQAVAARIRAGAASSNEEAYRRMLRAGGIDAINEEIDTYEAMVSQSFVRGRPTIIGARTPQFVTDEGESIVARDARDDPRMYLNA